MIEGKRNVSLKKIMVHLDQGARTATRLEMAATIARRHRARLVGVFGQRSLSKQAVITWRDEDYVNAAAASKAAFDTATGDLVCAEWQDAEGGSDSALLTQTSERARCFDLVVMGQHDERANGHIPPHLVETVIVDSGRPVLVVPNMGDHASVFKRPLIVWNDSWAATHALIDALPLVKRCEEAIILSIDIRREDAESSPQEVAQYLGCHGIKSKAEYLAIGNGGVMEMLCSRIADNEADLLIMGAHSEGGSLADRYVGTRHVLRSMTVPVFMAN